MKGGTSMHYQELGFVNTRQMFRDAYERHYAVSE